MLEVRLVGEDGLKRGSKREVDVHEFNTATGSHSGAAVLTYPFLQLEPSTKFFLNATYGNAMNQDITFGGAGLRATVIHAGVNSGNADSGTADGTTSNKLVDSGQNFDTTIGPGALVHNTTDDTYALVTAVDSDTTLSLDTDIMVSTDDYTINTIWTGVAVQGTWNFADSGKFTITEAFNDDEATFNVDASHIWNGQYFVSVTGKVDLDVYDPAVNSMFLEFGLDNVTVGNPVRIDDYIDPGDFSEQSFVIPVVDLGLNSHNFNSMKISISRTGGVKPTIKFDDFQLENTGNPILFEISVPVAEKFHIAELVFSYADAMAGTLPDGTMPGLAYDQILALSALTNGFNITRTKDQKTLFSATIKTLGGHLSAGALASEPWSDGTNTFVTLRAIFKEPLILTGNADDRLTIQINDDMSGLLQFTAVARGSIETP